MRFQGALRGKRPLSRATWESFQRVEVVDRQKCGEGEHHHDSARGELLGFRGPMRAGHIILENQCCRCALGKVHEYPSPGRGELGKRKDPLFCWRCIWGTKNTLGAHFSEGTGEEKPLYSSAEGVEKTPLRSPVVPLPRREARRQSERSSDGQGI